MIEQKIKNYILDVCRASHEASKLSRTLSNTQRNKILNSIIDQLSDHKGHVFKRNSLDVKIAIKNKMITELSRLELLALCLTCRSLINL